MKRALLAVLGFYSRAVSPALPPRCRFHPTCSAYAAEAINVHGSLRGCWLAVRRLVKCAPWHPGGVDLVPPPASGTLGPGRASSTAEPAEPGPSRPHRATPPAESRANEEISVA